MNTAIPCIKFQPTLPVRGATFSSSSFAPSGLISTHAPRAGSDAWRGWRRSRPAYFNPRSPCGERPGGQRLVPVRAQFQPTLPVRGATDDGARQLCGARISTHAPRAGSDVQHPLHVVRPVVISTHAPRAGSDLRVFLTAFVRCLFQPTLPVRGATLLASVLICTLVHFNPRSPCGERQQALTNSKH